MNKIPVKLLQSPVVLVEYGTLRSLVTSLLGPDALQGFMHTPPVHHNPDPDAYGVI